VEAEPLNHLQIIKFAFPLLGLLLLALPAQPSGEALSHYVLGLQHAEEGELELAIAELRAARALDPQVPEIAIELADLLVQSQRGPEAIEVAEAAVTMRPDDARCHWLLGQAYALQSEREKALPSLQRAWELDKDKRSYLTTYLLALEAENRFEEALRLLTPEEGGVVPPGPYLMMRRAGLRNRLDRREEALEDYLAVLEATPEFPNAADHLIRNCRHLGPSPVTISVLSRAVELVPHRPDIRRELARGLILLRQGDEAIPHLEQLLAENPDDPGVLMQLGVLRFGQERLAEAIQLLRRARALNPSLPESNEWLWRALNRADSLRAALLTANEMVAASPESAQAAWYRASSLARLGRSDEALDVLRHAHELDPSHREARLLAAVLLEEKGDFVEARGHLERILQSRPQDRQTLFRMALVEERLGRIEATLKWFGRLLAAHPEDALALNYAGYLCAEHEIELSQALDWTGRAVAIEPGNAAYVDSHGWVLHKLGRHEEAVEFLERARQLDPGESEIMVHLAKAYRAAGRVADARRLLRALLSEQPGDREARELLQLWDRAKTDTGNSR
jgi:tetratricopeptide (TPR) repeat protein